MKKILFGAVSVAALMSVPASASHDTMMMKKAGPDGMMAHDGAMMKDGMMKHDAMMMKKAGHDGMMAYGTAKTNEAKIDMLYKRIQELEAMTAHAATRAQKESVTTSTNNNLVISGHMNRAMLWSDNGKNSNLTHVDNNSTSSRVRFDASGAYSNDLKVGARLEIEYVANNSNAAGVKDAGTPGKALGIRIAETYFKSICYGDVMLGHGSMATDSIIEATDISGTKPASNGPSGIQKTGGGIAFFDSAANAASTFTVGKVFESNDGLSLRNRARYTTPNFYGFKIDTSHSYQGKGDAWDVALKYAGKYEGTKLALQVGYADDKTLGNGNGRTVALALQPQLLAADTSVTQNYKLTNASFGILHSSGFNIHFAYSYKQNKQKLAKNGQVFFGKLGYKFKASEAGYTCLALEGGHFKNAYHLAETKIKAKSYGITLLQNLDRVSTDLYIAARRMKLDKIKTRTENFKSASTVLVGARVRI